jgi:hypothetical protein
MLGCPRLRRRAALLAVLAVLAVLMERLGSAAGADG